MVFGGHVKGQIDADGRLLATAAASTSMAWALEGGCSRDNFSAGSASRSLGTSHFLPLGFVVRVEGLVRTKGTRALAGVQIWTDVGDAIKV